MAGTRKRDEFSAPTKRTLERQAGGHCSNPDCRWLTRGSSSDGLHSILIGEASHITAAASGGPRFDSNLTPAERKSAENGIWLCKKCARAVDSTDPSFTVEKLRQWKADINRETFRAVTSNIAFPIAAHLPRLEFYVDLVERARTDIAVFKQTAKWPQTQVALTLHVPDLNDQLDTAALARVVTDYGDLLLVAPPGMGKTTTMFQIAQALLKQGKIAPIVVALGDWATSNEAILPSILRRPAFAGVAEAAFRESAATQGLVLLLDGWNELHQSARNRARVDLMQLKSEIPQIAFVISSRRQAMDIPFAGTRIDLLPLSQNQQILIAREMRGDSGEEIVDRAMRTTGIRDLVEIPLYLTTLLSTPEGSPFPETKEEILRRFVEAHENELGHAAALQASAMGFQMNYLEAIADAATRSANTAISVANARRCISATSSGLIADGQIIFSGTQPDIVLDTLVSSHVLTHQGPDSGYEFQHQQFQEWYASHKVEEAALRAMQNSEALRQLKSEILDSRSWTEAVLFAVERMSRGTAVQIGACANAIREALSVDPMLAAEMIFRGTDAIWSIVGEEIKAFATSWHNVGRGPRSNRFMILSGRPEFAEKLWPLLTHENEQVHLAVFRSADRFRPSVLGPEAESRIAALPAKTRMSILREVAMNGGSDGITLASAVAKKDSDPEIKAAVAESLSFRIASLPLLDLLRTADDATFDILARRTHGEPVDDPKIASRMDAAQKRLIASRMTPMDILRATIYEKPSKTSEEQISALVAAIDINRQDEGQRNLLYEVERLHPKAMAIGLLQILRDGEPVFYNAGDILKRAKIVVEDADLLKIAGASSERNNEADAAASVLGPEMAGILLDDCLNALKNNRNPDGSFNAVRSEYYRIIRNRIDYIPAHSLVEAIDVRSSDANDDQIAEFASLLSRDRRQQNDAPDPFDEDCERKIKLLAEGWGERLLLSETANRGHMAQIATLIGHFPSDSLFSVLRRLFIDNIRRFTEFRKAAESGNRDQVIMTEARSPHMHEYQRAFAAISSGECSAFMKEMLENEHFGEHAARTLALRWSKANEPETGRRHFGGVDLSRVFGRREARSIDADGSCEEADSIFAVAEHLTLEGRNIDLAVSLAIIGGRLPHRGHEDLIDRLILLAPRQKRASLLLSMVLAGRELTVDVIADGIAETFKDAETKQWILSDNNAYQLRDWLHLLPFATPACRVPQIIANLPDNFRGDRILKDFLRAAAFAPAEAAEIILFDTAERTPELYASCHWQSAVLALGTLSVAHRVIVLLTEGKLRGKSGHDRQWQTGVAEMVSTHSEIRSLVRSLLNERQPDENLNFLAQCLTEMPVAEDLIVLVEYEKKAGINLLGWLSVQNAVTEKIASPDWRNSYNIVPVPITDVRKSLLAIVNCGGEKDRAARCLEIIDRVRDEYGAPETEPRHPDLVSGKPWPLIN